MTRCPTLAVVVLFFLSPTLASKQQRDDIERLKRELAADGVPGSKIKKWIQDEYLTPELCKSVFDKRKKTIQLYAKKMLVIDRVKDKLKKNKVTQEMIAKWINDEEWLVRLRDIKLFNKKLVTIQRYGGQWKAIEDLKVELKNGTALDSEIDDWCKELMNAELNEDVYYEREGRVIRYTNQWLAIEDLKGELKEKYNVRQDEITRLFKHLSAKLDEGVFKKRKEAIKRKYEERARSSKSRKEPSGNSHHPPRASPSSLDSNNEAEILKEALQEAWDAVKADFSKEKKVIKAEMSFKKEIIERLLLKAKDKSAACTLFGYTPENYNTEENKRERRKIHKKMVKELHPDMPKSDEDKGDEEKKEKKTRAFIVVQQAYELLQKPSK